MKCPITAISVFILNVAFSYMYVGRYFDIVDRYVSAELAMFVVPSLFGVFVGMVAIRVLSSDWKVMISYGWLLVFSCCAALLFPLYYVIGAIFVYSENL